MAHLPVIEDVYRCSLEWQSTNGQHATNVLHIYAPGFTAAEVFEALDADVTANMWDCVSSSYAVGEVRILKLDGTSPTVGFTGLDTDGRWSGNASGQPIPQSAGLVKLLTDLRGPAHRGRVYLPAVAEDVQNGGFLSSTVQGNIQTAWDAFLAALASDTRDLVVASYKHASKQFVTAIVAELATGTQRRRQRRNR